MRMQKTQYSQTSNTLRTEKHDKQIPYLNVCYKLLEYSFVLVFNIAHNPSTHFPKDLSWVINKAAQGQLLVAQQV